MSQRKATNPFYVLLVVVGGAFVLTACAYGVMAFFEVSESGTEEVLPENGLVTFMDENGMLVLGIEVALLGIFTVGAIWTDAFWQRRIIVRKIQDSAAKNNQRVNENQASVRQGEIT